LAYASDELKRDKEVVLEAVKQNWRALDYLSEELQMEIVQCWAKRMDCEVKNE
jgi:hypothetical protein